jgi:hypothetical protein
LNTAKVCSAAPTANGVAPRKARRFKVVIAELLRRNLLIFQFLEMILWNKNSTLNQFCKVAVNPCSITC